MGCNSVIAALGLAFVVALMCIAFFSEALSVRDGFLWCLVLSLVLCDRSLWRLKPDLERGRLPAGRVASIVSVVVVVDVRR